MKNLNQLIVLIGTVGLMACSKSSNNASPSTNNPSPTTPTMTALESSLVGHWQLTQVVVTSYDYTVTTSPQPLITTTITSATPNYSAALTSGNLNLYYAEITAGMSLTSIGNVMALNTGLYAPFLASQSVYFGLYHCNMYSSQLTLGASNVNSWWGVIPANSSYNSYSLPEFEGMVGYTLFSNSFISSLTTNTLVLTNITPGTNPINGSIVTTWTKIP